MTPRINSQRLWASILDSAAIGATSNGGLDRVSLSDADHAVRDWFGQECLAAGCTVTVDDMGNMFARRCGRQSGHPPILIGSHLDSQPSGGRFDGVLGVLAALEVVRTLNDYQVETAHPLEVVNWTNEEGTRFPPAMFASGVFAGVRTKDQAYATRDHDGRTFGAELERIGYRGPETCGDHPLAGYCELHIEQGPVLESAQRQIGVVTGVQGMRWYDLEMRGATGHAGTTPMHLRQDAMLGAARAIEAFHRIAVNQDDTVVVTTGAVKAEPGSRNVIAGRTVVTVDMRHPDTVRLNTLEEAFHNEVGKIANDLGLQARLERIWASDPVAFDARCIDAVRASAAAEGYTSLDMMSGAGHDAVNIALRAPTSMIFVPCAEGISHNEAEHIEPADAAAGAQVLLGTVLRLDEVLHTR